jgi:anti-sigma factor RsiW
MYHKPYNNWILNNTTLTKAQQNELDNHLESCVECQKLELAWNQSQDLLKNTAVHAPTSGFTQRWLSTLAKRRELENNRQVRRWLFGLTVFLGIGSIVYIIQNNLLVNWLVAGLNLFSSFIVALSKGLVGLSEFFFTSPVAIYLVGFVILGALVAFIFSSAFALWNLLKKGQATHETVIEK